MDFKVNLSRPDIGQAEIDAVSEVLRGPDLSLGPKLREFEGAFADYIGRKRAVAVSSGTSGLFLCAKALDIGEGDEVITTPFTFIASATSMMMAGAKPVFVDIDPESLNIDTSRLDPHRTKNVASPMAMLLATVFVTASAGHRPSIWISTGFSRQMPRTRSSAGVLSFICLPPHRTL